MSYQDSPPQDETVYFPYEIEEPDDEPTLLISRPGLRRLPDYMDCWQRELIEYIDDINSDPDYARNLLIQNPRGLKRKSIDTCPLQKQPQSFMSMASAEGPHTLGVGPRRKKLRVISREIANQPAHSVNDFREAHSNWSSSSELDDETTDEASTTDDMDID